MKVQRLTSIWRRWFASARVRILASSIALLVLSTALGIVALREVLIARAGERVDDALVQETGEFRRLARDGRDPRTGRPFGDDVEALFDVFLSRNVPTEGEIFFTFVGQELYRASSSRALRDANLERVLALNARGREGGGEIESAGSRLRYVTVPVRIRGRQRGVFAVTIRLEGELDEVNDTVEVAAGVFGGVLLLASLLAWIVAGRVLAPLRLLADTARSISETDLTRRIPIEGRDEIADLGRRFNEMLDRLEAAFASQKEFISDAGHELRTPITIVRGHLELLGDDPEERREAVELVTDELDRMTRFVDDLLLLAKAERPDFLRLEPIDVDDLARELFTKASALAGRDWQVESVGAGRINGDRQRLTQAVMSLSQNAVQHTKEGDVIALGAAVSDGSARLWVRDTGTGVPPEDQGRIFERFARGGGSPPTGEGIGLGLAIVRAIAEAHGGRVDLESRLGVGSTFTVVIPTRPPRTVDKV